MSANRGDGRSYVCASLAISLSQLDRRTLLIDADTVRPSQHVLFAVDNSRGMTDVLSSGAQPADCIDLLPAFPLLSLLPGGPRAVQPLKLLQAAPFAKLMQGTTSEFDYVILDTPSARQEAFAVAVAAGSALVLTRNKPNPLGSVQALVNSLVNAGVQVTGVVINDH